MLMAVSILDQDYDGGRSGGSSFRDEAATRRGYDEYDAGEYENPDRVDSIRKPTSFSSSPTSLVGRSAARNPGTLVGMSAAAKPASTPATVDLLGGFDDEPAPVLAPPPPASAPAPVSNTLDGEF